MRITDSTPPLSVLLAEDNPGDVRLIQEVLGRALGANEVHVVRDGLEALQFLRREGPFANAPPIGLVLLDLSMPRMDGREFLTVAKADPVLRRIPVVVLTSSVAEEDIAGAYDRYANGYVRKPADLGQFDRVVRQLHDFWVGIAEVPASLAGYHRGATPAA